MIDMTERSQHEADIHTLKWVEERRERTRRFYREEITADLWKHFWNRLGDLKGKSVLEYGCGDGRRIARLLRRQAGRVVGIDISPEMIAVAETRLANAERVDLRVMDAHSLDLADDSFDQIVGISILHHLNLPVACSELYRVLKPGGEGLFVEPLGFNPVFNLYRTLTPECRTPDEKPFRRDDFQVLNDKFQTTFEAFTLLSNLSAWELFTPLSPIFRMIDSSLLSIPRVRLMARDAVIHIKKSRYGSSLDNR